MKKCIKTAIIFRYDRCTDVFEQKIPRYSKKFDFFTQNRHNFRYVQYKLKLSGRVWLVYTTKTIIKNLRTNFSKRVVKSFL